MGIIDSIKETLSKAVFSPLTLLSFRGGLHMAQIILSLVAFLLSVFRGNSTHSYWGYAMFTWAFCPIMTLIITIIEMFKLDIILNMLHGLVGLHHRDGHVLYTYDRLCRHHVLEAFVSCMIFVSLTGFRDKPALIICVIAYIIPFPILPLIIATNILKKLKTNNPRPSDCPPSYCIWAIQFMVAFFTYVNLILFSIDLVFTLLGIHGFNRT
ncbi:hypothetical protein PBY51_001592 [Eleginops maclovinus]|uniref:MARVEL domain-containing protein n=1 Tax=Eleginops maclovinus TaxID=56733 RepID=A0AAN7WY92_ELEMC|nr:hypothetical protein PBY51_001592 [Eleginops maclovinus]